MLGFRYLGFEEMVRRVVVQYLKLRGEREVGSARSELS